MQHGSEHAQVKIVEGIVAVEANGDNAPGQERYLGQRLEERTQDSLMNSSSAVVVFLKDFEAASAVRGVGHDVHSACARAWCVGASRKGGSPVGKKSLVSLSCGLGTALRSYRYAGRAQECTTTSSVCVSGAIGGLQQELQVHMWIIQPPPPAPKLAGKHQQ